MKKQVPVEIHTHTHHSDGHFTPEELVQESKKFGYKGIIITDHNSSAAYRKMKEAGLIDDPNFIILKGMEWTTYFGHMLVHEADYDVDWREAIPDQIDPYMKEVKDANGLVGIAHPFDMGSPMCTGCHWDYDVKDYNLVDYIEIWNSNMPHTHWESKKAYEMWLDCLNEGYQISCSTGRDWHRPDSQDSIMGVTYLELSEDYLNKKNFKQSLANGQFYITLGPTMTYNLKNETQNIYLGDEISIPKKIQFEFTLNPADLAWYRDFEIEDIELLLYNNSKIIYREEAPGAFLESKQFKFENNKALENGYLRFEVRGKILDSEEVPLLIANPIYIK